MSQKQGINKKPSASGNIIPTPSSINSFNRSKNQPTSGYQSNNNNNSSNAMNSSDIMMTRQAPDPEEIKLMESAKRGWLNQQNQVDEKKQKQKDLKRLTNILTYDNLDKIKKDFLKYAMDASTCNDAIASIMEKAITESKYTSLYG